MVGPALAVQLEAQMVTVDPARARGLRRRRARAACPPVEATPLPAPPSAVEVLALLTRVRSVRVATGELNPGRLYDLRAFKTCWAELSYLHRLAAGGRHGATAVTSMRQLVAGIAPLHPAWKLSGDSWEDRDRHHQSVRRRLCALTAAGLVRWTIGVDADLEERRTELRLLPVPELLPDELAAAQERLERWEARYGSELNTGSPIGITNVKQAARPLSASERQRRGCQHARHAAQAKLGRCGSQTNTAPPFGAPTPSENNNLEPGPSPIELWSLCEPRTRVHAPEIQCPTSVSAAITVAVTQETASNERNVGVVWGSPGWVAGLQGRVAARAGVVGLKERQVRGRAVEVAGWGLEREWPVGRLREAWVVARHGVGEAALHGGRAARPLARERAATGGGVGVGRVRGGRDDYLALRRAVARYEANRVAAPEGFPSGGLAALLHLAVLAREGGGGEGPMLLAYGVGALDLLSRRMRATATSDGASRQRGQMRRARERRGSALAGGRWAHRVGGWPAWVVLDQAGLPVLELNDRFEQVLVSQPGAGMRVPWVERAVLRDAILLRYGKLPAHMDGRAEMAQRARGVVLPAERRPAVDPAVAELARLTGLGVRQLERFDSEHLETMLARARAQRRAEQDLARARADRERSNEK